MTTIVFPGQGSQFIRMGKEFYDNFLVSKEILQLIEDAVDLNLKKIIFEENDKLNLTEYTQISIFSVSMMIFQFFNENFIKKNNLKIKYVLGHSLGEYSAFAASEVFKIDECSKLLKIRGRLMQNADPTNQSGMAAIIGMNCDKVEEILRLENSSVNVANDNAPGQVVISGKLNEIKKIENILSKKGAKKIVYLNVSSAFHSSLMNIAENEMLESLKQIKFHDPIYSIISNYSGNVSENKDLLFTNLSKQISNKVKWLDSIKFLENNKVDKIIEIGPGKVLTGIIKRISKDFKLFNLNDLKDINIIENEL